MNKTSFIFRLNLMVLLWTAHSSFATSFDVWARKKGLHTENRETGRLNPQKIELKKSELKELTLFDVQYQKKISFLGSSLSSLISSYKVPESQNLLLLHFDNGMMIPVKKGKLLDDIYVAVSLKSGKKFENIERKHPQYKDPRPLEFKTNKMVLPNLELAMKNANKQKGGSFFSPWLYVSSLTGIEFVNSSAYDRQFIVEEKGLKDSKTKMTADYMKGFLIYKERCSYCHGMNQSGATLGWDFFDPLPIFKRRTADNLNNMVKYSYHDAFERGLLMPKQENISVQEMDFLLKWAEELYKQGIKKYD